MRQRLAPCWPHILLAVALVLVLSPSPMPWPLVDSLRSATSALTSGQPNEAVEAFETAIAFEPEMGALHPLAAAASLAGGDAARAVDHLRAADRLLPPDPSRQCLLGIALQESGDVPGAVATWQSQSETCWQQPGILDRLAQIAIDSDDRAAAEAMLESLARLQPADSQPQLRLALVIATRRPEEALPHLRSADALTPGGNLLAQALVRGITDAQAEAQPAYTLAQVGQALARQGEWRLAAWAFESAIDLEPGYVEARAYLGLALDRAGGDGLAQLQAAEAAAPSAALPHLFLGMHWHALGQMQPALAELMTAADLDPSNPAITAELGGVYADLGDVQPALAAFRTAAALAPQEPGFWLLLAEFSLSREVEVEAVGLPSARNAAVLNPHDPAAIDALGYACLLVDDFGLAERFLIRAVELDPLRARTQYHLGLLRLSQGDTATATLALQTAVRLDPEGQVGDLALRTLQRFLPPPP